MLPKEYIVKCSSIDESTLAYNYYYGSQQKFTSHWRYIICSLNLTGAESRTIENYIREEFKDLPVYEFKEWESMKMIKFNDLPENAAIWCETKEKAKRYELFMHKIGKKTKSGLDYRTLDWAKDGVMYSIDGGYWSIPLKCLNDAKKHVNNHSRSCYSSEQTYSFDQIYELNSKTMKVTKQQLKEIHDIACETWKVKITQIAAQNPFENDVELSDEQIQEMFKAATDKQKPVLEKIFGEQEKKLFLGNAANKTFYKSIIPDVFVYKHDNDNCFIFVIEDGKLRAGSSQPFGGIDTYDKDYEVTQIGNEIDLEEYV